MITDEQKAIELIGCEGRSNCIKCGGRLSVEKGCSEFQNIMAMAQWKDEQFAAEKQALIDKACEWLKDNFETQSEIVGYSPARGRVRYCVSKDFIVVSEMIDRFRKTIEERNEKATEKDLQLHVVQDM